MPFMLPRIELADWYEIDTTAGTDWLPADLLPSTMLDGETSDDPAFLAKFSDYCEGTPQLVTMRRHWYGARLSAPGYLDCTEWSVFASMQEARAFLRDFHHTCPDCGLDTDLPTDEDGACQCPDTED